MAILSGTFETHYARWARKAPTKKPRRDGRPGLSFAVQRSGGAPRAVCQAECSGGNLRGGTKRPAKGLRYCGLGLPPSAPQPRRLWRMGPGSGCLLPGSLEQKVPVGKPHKYRYAFGWLLRAAVMADDDPFALAERRVWDAQKIVAEQKGRIAGLRAVGASTLDAVQALSAFESNLELFTEHALLSARRRRR